MWSRYKIKGQRLKINVGAFHGMPSSIRYKGENNDV
jgi:hypothetical protein